MKTFMPIETKFFHWVSWLAIHWKGGFLIEAFSVAVEISGLAFLTSIGGEPAVLLSEPNVVSFHDTCVDIHIKSISNIGGCVIWRLQNMSECCVVGAMGSS